MTIAAAPAAAAPAAAPPAGAPPAAPTAPPAAPKVDAKPEGAPAKPPEQPKPPEKRKFKYQANGREVEREYSDADIVRKLQIADGSEERIRRASELERETNEWRDGVKKRGLAAFREQAEKLGVADFDKQIEDYMIERFAKTHKPNEDGKWEPKSQEEIEIEELRNFKKTATERETKAAEEKRIADEQAEIAALSDQYAKEMRPILQKLGYGPKADALLAPIVGDVLLGADNKGIRLTTEQAVAESREILSDFFTSHLTAMSPDDFKGTLSTAIQQRMADAPAAELVSLIGTEGIKKILAHTVEQLRGGPPQVQQEEPRRKPRISREEEMEAARDAMVFGQRRQR